MSVRVSGYDERVNDMSRQLRYRLGALCERYNAMIADKDALDFRLGSPEPFGDTASSVNAEEVYGEASGTVSSDLRALIIEMTDITQQIRAIEGF